MARSSFIGVGPSPVVYLISADLRPSWDRPPVGHVIGNGRRVARFPRGELGLDSGALGLARGGLQ
jgi:hypothetical protein